MQAEKSIEEHIRQGTYIEARHGDRLPVANYVMGNVGPCPESLGPEGREHWSWLCLNVPAEIQGPSDYNAFKKMSSLYQKSERYSAAIDEMDPSLTSKMMNTFLAIERQYWAIAKDYGLTAASRTKVKSPVKVEEDEDPLARLHGEARESA